MEGSEQDGDLMLRTPSPRGASRGQCPMKL